MLSTSYPRESERPLLFSLIQQLWDRSDPNGYAQHMTTDPYPDTPPVASPQNQDPHGHPRRTTAAQDQKSEHLRITDSISDLCGNGPCHSE